MPKRDRTIFQPQIPVWKVRDIIARLGGVGPTTEKLMAKGFFPPPADTVQGWSTRNSVPGAWSPALFALAPEAADRGSDGRAGQGFPPQAQGFTEMTIADKLALTFLGGIVVLYAVNLLLWVTGL